MRNPCCTNRKRHNLQRNTVFKAKSNLEGATPRELIFRDFKDFDMSGHKVGIGQLELTSLDLVTPELKSALQSELQKVKAEGRHTAILVLTDVMAEGSELLCVSENASLINEALKPDTKMWMPGVMSRKKQVVPPLEAVFKA